MSGQVRVLAPAKINLYLGVGPRRPDGFHELATVYHAISLHDELTAAVAGGVLLTVSGEGAGQLPTDRGNLAVQAAHALADRLGVTPAVRLDLHKRIPVAGGLAGGSADAAAALVACDSLWGGGCSRAELAAVAATLGSDVPFLLYGGTALGSGRGEVVEPVVMSGAVLHWVVAAAEGGLSTPQVYAELDRLREAGLAPPPCLDASALLAAVGQDDPGALGAAMHNDLEVAALSLRPDLRGILAAGLAAGAVAGMVSGSGPTCVFLAATATEVELVAKRLETAPGCRKVLVATGPAAPTTGVEG